MAPGGEREEPTAGSLWQLRSSPTCLGPALPPQDAAKLSHSQENPREVILEFLPTPVTMVSSGDAESLPPAASWPLPEIPPALAVSPGLRVPP